ncbi:MULTISPECIES: hypothetical protein [Thalassospira]|uniref:hypothetical protein n=1 Tax=Thalassospira TaxID=168934 RepID=UPI00241F67C1|nr:MULTISPECIES: hypothetical protein [Thalassospira]
MAVHILPAGIKTPPFGHGIRTKVFGLNLVGFDLFLADVKTRVIEAKPGGDDTAHRPTGKGIKDQSTLGDEPAIEYFAQNRVKDACGCPGGRFFVDAVFDVGCFDRIDRFQAIPRIVAAQLTLNAKVKPLAFAVLPPALPGIEDGKGRVEKVLV